jgi:glutamate/aspartate transport system permease protein
MAVGFTTPQYYRYAAAHGFRIIIPPLTSESMNIFKNSAWPCVSIPELTQFAMQVGEEPRPSRSTWRSPCSMPSALVINRILAWIEKRARAGRVLASGAGGH